MIRPVIGSNALHRQDVCWQFCRIKPKPLAPCENVAETWSFDSAGIQREATNRIGRRRAACARIQTTTHSRLMAERPTENQKNSATFAALSVLIAVALGLVALFALVLPQVLWMVLVIIGLGLSIGLHYVVWGRWLTITLQNEEREAEQQRASVRGSEQSASQCGSQPSATEASARHD